MARPVGAGKLSFRLVLVTDRTASRLPPVEAVRRAVEGGVDCVQLRERGLSDRDLCRLAEELRRVTRRAGAALIVGSGAFAMWRELRLAGRG